MGAILLDTTVLIDALRGRRAGARLSALRDVGDAPFVCAVNVEEVVRGLRPAEEAAAGGAVRPVQEPFGLFVLGVPMVPELAAAIPHGFAAVDAALADVTAPLRMPNFIGATQDSATGYDAERLARLREIKHERDPQGVIRSNKPV